MFYFCFSLFFFFFFTFSLFVFSFSVFKRLKTIQQQTQDTQLTQKPEQSESDPLGLENSVSETLEDRNHQAFENDPTHLTRSARSLLLEILPSDSPKWESLFENDGGGGDPSSDGSALLDGESSESGGDQRVKKKKKKRTKKKSSISKDDENGEQKFAAAGRGNKGPDSGDKEQDLVCLYPFTSSSSATQRKIKQQYDQLMKCHESKGLTLAQVGQFANCLVEARNELQHKADVIQRKFTITKALLFKADRSSFDRLRQQIYKLELEQKRLEEDAFVYNWLQQQLKLSPAYKKMLEIGAHMEMKAKSGELTESESTDSDFSDISFEELLAQEKKDSFWQRNKNFKSCSS
ncbi:uncharacterized protein LOC107403948 [Ziziphus jujuba]|uniref:Uncharacterized protein LOC107403948 n=1 Tax=Ziziphus jujuba TaxID=326968 RepID=A0A6P3YRB9_ZIZJJ|nr:uncharacterized protein LOC107403948 [Ziziphus jujuba]